MYFKQLIRRLRGDKFFYDKDNLFQEHSLNYSRTVLAVRFFYGFSFFYTLTSYSWMSRDYKNASFFKPLWALGTLNSDWIRVIFQVNLVFGIGFSLLAFFFPRSLLCRFGQALTTFYLVLMINSDGHYAHNIHGFLFISLAFLFFPLSYNVKPFQKRLYKHQCIQVFWFAQLLICTFYLMTGYWKINGILECLVLEDLVCQMDHKILINISAREALNYFGFAPLRDFFFKYPWVSFWSYMGTLWIHLVSMHFLFRLKLHRVFGFFRFIFHIGTFLFFGVNFSIMAGAVAAIFIFSPFDRGMGVAETLYEITNLPPFYEIKHILICLAAKAGLRG